MARFNATSVFSQPRKSPVTPNLAGGKGFRIDPKVELAGIILTSWAKDSFYRSFAGTNARMQQLIDICGPLYAAKCAYVARKEHGLRSISHLVMSEVQRLQARESADWTAFYRCMVVRPDDILETLAITDGKAKRAMRRGFAAALESMSEYKLAKYAKFGREQKVNLNDAVRICHPRPTEALSKLMFRTLKNTDTWEARGNTAESWLSLLSENKLGYDALRKNLRNIEKHNSPELLAMALAQLTDPARIAKSMVFPFQFMTTAKNTTSREVHAALETACEISLTNVPVFDGDTVIMLDVSGSMRSNRVNDIAALFTAILAKRSDARVVAFDHTAREFHIGKASALSTALTMPFPGGSTNFSAAYQFLRDNQVHADRLFVITDMQHWVGGDTSYGPFLEWCALTGCDPQVWSLDLAHYGTSQFPSGKCRQLFGFSGKLFGVVPDMERDMNAFVNRIESVEFV